MQVVAALMFTFAMGSSPGALAWAWANGSLRDSDQERFDHEFERISRRLSDLTVHE